MYFHSHSPSIFELKCEKITECKKWKHQTMESAWMIFIDLLLHSQVCFFECIATCELKLFMRTFHGIISINPLTVPDLISLLSIMLFSWFLKSTEFGIGWTFKLIIWHFSLFSSSVCLILYWNYREKFCLGHLWELKGPSVNRSLCQLVERLLITTSIVKTEWIIIARQSHN